jgi:hypothetical protein
MSYQYLHTTGSLMDIYMFVVCETKNVFLTLQAKYYNVNKSTA